jgi:uncharacterized repeat protein (TIGR03803 family)
MINHYFRKGVSLALCAIAATMACAAGQATFHVITYESRFGEVGAIIEGSPRVFYFNAGTNPSGILSITPQGTQSVLATFPSGDNIQSALASGANGRFYSSVEPGGNPGNVFSVSPEAGSKQVYSSQTLVPSLQQNLPDGTFLSLAGTTGGTWYLQTVDLEGNVTPIYQFPSDERALTALYASDGNYYGISATNAGYLYRLTPSGTLTTLLNFPSGTLNPPSVPPLIQASDGNLYGATYNGGANGYGAIYKLTLAGQYTLLYSFPKSPNSPPTALIEGSDGNLYGATYGHIASGGYSLLFRITKLGEYTLLYPMSNITADGACQCSLVQGSDGNIYGTALSGGPDNGGAVFVLELGLPKPAPAAQRFYPNSAAVGTPIRIWGNNLLGASVEFNGVAATEVTNSGPNYVWATVPAGATSGPITITTPGGTVTTKASFTVE